ncbi:hypothetical protein G4L39_06010 [Limisphaera ngatamarikiensis]|uniref:Bacterial repeat domain-containing protein n=1 Tax=Limisphaera ngatamarikiensis TaxID=1324935 RepID=A0A6M1S0Q1_9BACT|nr:T9SS type A sorting domain-containing protein [Limisphaera ngatamarikiensis]NGO38950.1 hypothetical protein [Limisphaera ngatamarikiensis]
MSRQHRSFNQSQLRWGLWMLLLAMGCGGFSPANAAVPLPAAQQFVPGQWRSWEELPESRLRASLARLAPEARQRAVAWLQSFQFTGADCDSLEVDADGGVFYRCRFVVTPMPASAAPAEPSPGTAQAPLPVSPFPDSLKFHSRPGAPNVIFLNFAGETVTNTQWNTDLGRAVIPALPFSMDADFTTFSDSEQAVIRAVWQRVAEDYAPFDVDVTTERPAVFNNRTAMVLITRNTDANGDPNPSSDAGGVSYVNVFGTLFYARYRPCWVYANNLGFVESYIAEASSHEAGHNLGLSHDGRTDGVEYYAGHGSGDISWAPIMGAGYNRNVTQWSKGEYYLANNTQDDLAVIASKLTYRPDDHGQTPATATALVLTGGTNIVSTTPLTDPANTNRANKGVIEKNDDADWFSLVTGTGPVRLTVWPWVMPSGTRGGNLDLAVELYDSAGNLLLTNNPPDTTSATISTQLQAGMYFLVVRNSGAGDPFAPVPSGYSAYGSLGQYFIEGWVTDPSGVVVPPVAELTVADITEPGQARQLLTVVYSDNAAIQVSTVGDGDLWVTGPNGYAQPVRLESVNPVTNAASVTAVYSLPPPNGLAWSVADNGTYEVWMVGGAVGDIEGGWVSAGLLGRFTVAVPIVYYEARMDEDPGWTLDPLWQYGVPAYSSGGPTGGATGSRIIGYNLSGNYENNLPMRYATTPPFSTVGATSLSLRFQRWLRLRRGDSAVIEVSTNGTDWIRVWSANGAVTDNAWRQVQYELPAPVVGARAVQVRWGLGSNPSQSDLGWHLDDVQVLGQGVWDQAPPRPVLRVSDITLAGTITHSCTVEFEDETAVRLASLDSADLWITGPNGYAEWAAFVGADAPMDAARITATYSIPAPNGAWEPEHNGIYTVTLVAGAVEDVWGHATPETVLGTFEVRVAAPESPTLAVFPEEGWAAGGPQGGPFTPAEAVYVVTNSGNASLRFAVESDAAWLQALPHEADLAPGESRLVQATLTPEAAGLAPGIYTATLSFQNLSASQSPIPRPVSLEVRAPRQFLVQVTSEPPDWGEVQPGGGTFTEGAFVTFQAVPRNWFAFAEWGGDVRATTNPITLVVTQDMTLVARFVELTTTNHPTPLWWLAALGYTNDFETAVESTGANGLPLWQSYIAGLDPSDPASQLRLEIRPELESATLRLEWDPQPGRLYTLWEAESPDGPYARVSGAVDLDSSVRTWTVPLGVSRARYYRLSVRLDSGGGS